MLSQMALHLFFLNISLDAESSVTYSAMVKKEGVDVVNIGRCIILLGIWIFLFFCVRCRFQSGSAFLLSFVCAVQGTV